MGSAAFFKVVGVLIEAVGSANGSRNKLKARAPAWLQDFGAEDSRDTPEDGMCEREVD
jgi:hypothetical protein